MEWAPRLHRCHNFNASEFIHIPPLFSTAFSTPLQQLGATAVAHNSSPAVWLSTEKDVSGCCGWQWC